jgi:hypothetical protein
MDPKTDIKQMRNASISRVEEELAHVYEQIKSADEQLAHMEDQLSRKERDTPRSNPRRSRTRPWLRGIIGFLIAAYVVATAFVSQSSYGGAVARQAPQLVSALTLPVERLVLFAEPNPSSVQSAAAEPAHPAQVAPHDVTPGSVPTSAEPNLSQTMARDLANVEREIEQLKASQQQLASDNAKAVEQIKASQEQGVSDIARSIELLKASQEQLAQRIAKASQQNPRPKASTPQPQGTVGMRKPAPTPASSQASAHPQAPTQLPPEAR